VSDLDATTMRFFASLPPPPKPPLRPPAPPLARRTAPRGAAWTNHRVPAAQAPAAAKELPIVGRWQDSTGTELIEFRADGTVLDDPGNGEQLHGRYLLREDNLNVQMNGIEPLTFTATINGKTLQLKAADGQITEYLRVR